MAKKKDKKASGKLPKKIGRVKLPKALRKAGDAVIETARSPKGQQAIAAGLAVAASAAAKRGSRAAERPIPPRPPEPSRPGEPGVPPDYEKIVEAFSTATTAFLDGFFGRRR